MDRKASSDRSCHWLFNYVDLTRSGFISGLFNGATFYASYSVWNAYNDARFSKIGAFMNLADEVFDHLAGRIEVGNNSIFEWSNCNDISRSSTNHLLCFDTNSKNGAGILMDSNNAGLIKDYAFTANINKGICGAKVDCHIATEESPTIELVCHLFTPYFLGKKILISRSADSTESEPCTRF